MTLFLRDSENATHVAFCCRFICFAGKFSKPGLEVVRDGAFHGRPLDPHGEECASFRASLQESFPQCVLHSSWFSLSNGVSPGEHDALGVYLLENLPESVQLVSVHTLIATVL